MTGHTPWAEIVKKRAKPATYVEGDATDPIGDGPKIIVHVCNDIGGWGRGFVLALSARWPDPEQQYREWHASQDRFALGEVLFVNVARGVHVANLIGQHGMANDENGQPPVRYEAIEAGLSRVAGAALLLRASVHMPRIGCGLAGGSWKVIEPLIESTLTARKVPVTVYDYRGNGAISWKE